jgi:membrane associated rhomboid family serine protease
LDFRKLGNLLIAAGATALLGAVIWWFSFYSSLVRELGRATGGQGDASVLDAWTCLYSSSGVCALVAAVAPLAGRTAYEPMLFWFGLAGLIVGVVVRLAAKPTAAA